MLNWFQMIKTYIINCGKDIQVFINGDSREEVEPIHWSLFNHGATNQTDPEWVDENTFTFLDSEGASRSGVSWCCYQSDCEQVRAQV